MVYGQSCLLSLGLRSTNGWIIERQRLVDVWIIERQRLVDVWEQLTEYDDATIIHMYPLDDVKNETVIALVINA